MIIIIHPELQIGSQGVFVDFLIYQEGHISLTLGFFYFWIGMYFEEYHEKITSKWISLLALISGLVIWAVNPSGIFKIPYLA